MASELASILLQYSQHNDGGSSLSTWVPTSSMVAGWKRLQTISVSLTPNIHTHPLRPPFIGFLTSCIKHLKFSFNIPTIVVATAREACRHISCHALLVFWSRATKHIVNVLHEFKLFIRYLSVVLRTIRMGLHDCMCPLAQDAMSGWSILTSSMLCLADDSVVVFDVNTECSIQVYRRVEGRTVCIHA